MDRFKKLKKEKSVKCSAKDHGPLFITDVKSFKENIKIKEILRTVKMNSSMRLKTPPGSTVTNNKDFNDEGCFEESSLSQNSAQILSATNPDVVVSNAEQKESEINSDNNTSESTQEHDSGNESIVVVEDNKCNILNTDTHSIEQSTKFSQDNCDNRQSDAENTNINSIPNEKPNECTRDRKLSLDHTLLTRREGLSQSELDLHSIGKSPLERKSSFFRKTMDSFVKNTTEMFRKQNKSLQRRVSMSVSLQSLNDKSLPVSDYREVPIQQVYDSTDDCRTNLQAPSQIARSNSSLSSMAQRHCPGESPAESYAGSQPTLENLHSCSAHSLHEAYLKDTIPTRAISMSSGLDSPFGHPRRKAPRSNRVTWVASEGLTNYLRRVIQDEKKSKEMQSCQSYQDFSCIPENDKYSRKADMKGRRLSYQRAVSGEDPVIPSRYYTDSTLRKKDQIPEMCENRIEVAKMLKSFNIHGVPQLQGFEIARIPETAFAYLLWACGQNNFEESIDIASLSLDERERQLAIIELIRTEAEHINHLTSMLEVFLAAAHALQSNGRMLNIDTEKLFANIPDVLNASLYFWNIVLMPMILDAVDNNQPFNTRLMYEGFTHFSELLAPYEKYVVEQPNLIEYYKLSKANDTEFALFLGWCQKQNESQRLELNDFLAKPMQRLTKYPLLLGRIIESTDPSAERSSLEAMEMYVRGYLKNVNRSVRQREEFVKLNKVHSLLEANDCELKDDEVERFYKSYSAVNLRRPMFYCRANHSRCLIYEAQLRYREGTKEFAVTALITTDMILICKNLIVKKKLRLKLVRPVYMIDKLVQIPIFAGKSSTELCGIGYVVVDDLGSACTSFMLTDPAKDADSSNKLKVWEYKVNEAKLTYELTIWSARNPNREITLQEINRVVEFLQIRTRSCADEAMMKYEARERVAAVTHESASADPSQFFPGCSSEVVLGVIARVPRVLHRNHIIVHRTLSTDYYKPTTPIPQVNVQKPASPKPEFEEAQPEPSTSKIQKSASVEPLVLSPLPTAEDIPSIILQESDGRPHDDDERKAPLTPKDNGNNQTPRLQQNNVATLVYSVPSISIQPSTPKSNSSPSTISASQKLYQYHKEVLQLNKIEMFEGQQMLSSESRGLSYPPPSPNKSLSRGNAFDKPAKLGREKSMSYLSVESMSTCHNQ